MKISQLLIEKKKAISMSEVRRLIYSGFIKLNDKKVVDENVEVQDGDKIKIVKDNVDIGDATQFGDGACFENK